MKKRLKLSVEAGHLAREALGNGHSNAINLETDIEEIVSRLPEQIRLEAKEGRFSIPVILPFYKSYEPRSTVVIDPANVPGLIRSAIKKILGIVPQSLEEKIILKWRKHFIKMALQEGLKLTITRTYVCSECRGFPDDRDDCPTYLI